MNPLPVRFLFFRSPLSWVQLVAVLTVIWPSGCNTVPCRHRPTSSRPDGATILLASAQNNRITMFGEIRSFWGSERQPPTAVALKRHTDTEIGADQDPDVDSTGQNLVFSSTRHSEASDLYLKTVDGLSVIQLTSDPSSDLQPEISPDGRRVAFASNRTGNWDIWVVDLNGGAPVQVTQGMADEIHPSWSPDGGQLVYCSLPAEGGSWELWVTEVDARSARRMIGHGLFPAWSPQGNQIVYQRARDRSGYAFSVWTVTLLDGEPRFPTEVASDPERALILPSWSADGKRIAFTSVPLDQSMESLNGSTLPDSDIWLIDADGSDRVRLTGGAFANTAPTFSADGRVYFTSNRSGRENIWSAFPFSSTSGSSADADRGVREPIGADRVVPNQAIETVVRSSEWSSGTRF